MTEVLGMDEFPHHPIVDTETAISEFSDKTTQGEVLFATPADQPIPMFADDLLRSVATHLTRCHTTRFAKTPNPRNDGAYPDAKSIRRRPPRKATCHDRGNNPLA